MAAGTLYVTEFNTVGEFSGTLLGRLVMAEVPPVAQQTVSIGGSSVQSTTFNYRTRFVRLNTDTACCVEFGADPTSTTVAMRMAANQTEYFAMPPGAIGTMKVAVITL